ncbi:hypothetical protein DYB28_010783 [Aphanomyces astaci]|uniref:Uncharacterized protein n=2 Tax=Aphanomyces astaci TaxID=112090 RepID=A0A9X8HGB1_APHAT|nr:hypothetical protein DYB28_010783 [Aphanomyces astaci]
MKTTKNTDGSAWMTFMVPSCSDTGAEENVLPKPMLEELLQQRPNLKMVTLMEPLVGQLCNNTAFKADAYVDIDLKIQTKAGPVKIPGKARCCKKSYSIDEKRKLLAMFTATSHRKFCAEHGIPRSTWIDWQKRRTELATTRRNAKREPLRPSLGS